MRRGQFSKTPQNNRARALRFAKERTSTGQSQALWTFFVGMGVALAAMLHFGQTGNTGWFSSTEANPGLIQSDSSSEISSKISEDDTFRSLIEGSGTERAHSSEI